MGWRTTRRKGKTSGRAALAAVAMVVTGAVLSAGVPVPAAAAAATGTVPAYVDTLGGSGAADMYPSGLEVDPSDGTIVVADTGDNEIEKYSADGTTLLWKVGTYGFGTGQFNNPRDIGIDSSGNVYVADTANTRIVKLSRSGSWLRSWKGPSSDPVRSPIGLSVTGDLVYVADGNTKKVRVFGTDGTHVRSFGSNGDCTFSALRDVDADSQGNVYVANYTLHNILKLSSTGTCLTKWGSKGAGNGQFAAPYGVRLAHDPVRGEELVYVADSNNNRIQVFTKSGAFVAAMGSAGQHGQDGTFTQLRRVAVAPDGDVWGADLWGWRLERFDRTSTGWTSAQRIGDTVPQLTDTRVFNEPRGITFDAGGHLHVADTVHHRVVKMEADGTVVGACGMRGSGDGEFNWPRGAAVDPVTGDLWVVDTKQSRLQIMDADCSDGGRLGTKGTGTGDFHWPMAIAIRASDRTAWVADTNNNRVTVWDVATRTAIRSFGTKGSSTGQLNQPRGIAVSPVTGNVFVADRSNNRVVELQGSAGASSISVVGTYTASFQRPEGVAVDSSGRIHVADTLNDRLVVLDSAGGLLGTTTGPDGLSDPAGVAVGPDGRVYVSDTFGDRVQVFSYGVTPPPEDTTAPDKPTFSSPAGGSTVASPVTVAGAATDNVSVARVDVALKDRATNLWWNATTSTWGTFRWNATTLTAPGASSTTWSWSLPLPAGSYAAQARTVDTAGNISPTPHPIRRFSVP